MMQIEDFLSAVSCFYNLHPDYSIHFVGLDDIEHISYSPNHTIKTLVVYLPDALLD